MPFCAQNELSCYDAVDETAKMHEIPPGMHGITVLMHEAPAGMRRAAAGMLSAAVHPADIVKQKGLE